MAILKRPVSPRQKMINLMYVVLIAMLAFNVSSDVLDGFSVVENSLKRTTEQTWRENEIIYDNFDKMLANNKTKVKEWHEKTIGVKEHTQCLYDLIADIKKMIAIEADGRDGNVDYIKNKEDMEATAQVMLAPGKEWGSKLHRSIDDYREKMLALVTDSSKRCIIAGNLSTEIPTDGGGRSWQEYYFESMPAVAAMTMLTKLQNDIRYTEGEVLHTLMANIDATDSRVNSLEAMVIPNSRTVVRGNKFSANIVMAAVDTTQTPDIYIDGKKVALPDNIYETVCSQNGDYSLKGWLEMTGKNGEHIRRVFEQKYSVVEPTATISANLMNVLYAGYNNPISVSVPGVPLSEVTATMDGGILTKKADGQYIAKPIRTGKTATITVFATTDGKKQQMAQLSFRVRRLPEPTIYMDIKDERGSAEKYRGGAISRTALARASGIGAAIDDGILDVPFRVVSFETIFFDLMGNAVQMRSAGSQFSERQIESFKRLTRNRRFYVSHVTAVGPDGIERNLKTSMEIILK